MNGKLRGRQNSQIDDARTPTLHENQSTKIPVTRHQDSILLVGNAKQLTVVGLA